MGKSLNQMIEAVADAATGEFGRLKESGIKARSQGDQVTFTFRGASTTVGKNTGEIEGCLQSIGNVQFAGAMKEQAGTLNVALSSMGDAFSKPLKAISDDLRRFPGEVIKFGNLFIAVFKGLGRAFQAFGETVSARFEAPGKDLAVFIENPPGGVDCIGLTIGLIDEPGIQDGGGHSLVAADECNYSMHPGRGRLVDSISGHWHELPPDQRRRGDLLLFRTFRDPQHAGLLTEYPSGGAGLIHCSSSAGQVMEQPLSDTWRRMLTHVYRFKKKQLKSLKPHG